MSEHIQTLGERGKSYGDFIGNARISQSIKRAMRDSPNWESMSPDKQEALEVMASKIGRLLNGDPNHIDSWHDLAGYAILVEKQLREIVPITAAGVHTHG